ncbi:hypothetical protein B7C42_08394 [Nocardia cerradoensis]|uniref:Uncharacterized protein n=1 Tax=Nocardia cerradoensis TaxID=85688 RepID=A0A231GSJ0_9NOCA|nr:hypothetical protein B7C42_08394 [Nocardia cerradoensis]
MRHRAPSPTAGVHRAGLPDFTSSDVGVTPTPKAVHSDPSDTRRSVKRYLP